MKCEITYETDGGNGKITISGNYNEACEIKATLENSGCFNVIAKAIHESDPCDNCNKPWCYGCPYTEE